MWLNQLWHRWFGRSRPLSTALNQRQRPSFRPRLEAIVGMVATPNGKG